MMLLLLTACAPELVAIHEWDDGVVVDTAAGEVPIRVTTTEADVGWRTIVDAQHPENWVALDLDGGGREQVDLESDTWDIRFLRFNVSVNGGISGDLGGEAAFVPGITLSDGLTAPTTGWQTDVTDGPDEGSEPDYALFTWFLYNEATHVLTPDDGVWFVRATSGEVFALQFEDYYDSAGNSAVFTFRWTGPVAQP